MAQHPTNTPPSRRRPRSILSWVSLWSGVLVLTTVAVFALLFQWAARHCELARGRDLAHLHNVIYQNLEHEWIDQASALVQDATAGPALADALARSDPAAISDALAYWAASNTARNLISHWVFLDPDGNPLQAVIGSTEPIDRIEQTFGGPLLLLHQRGLRRGACGRPVLLFPIPDHAGNTVGWTYVAPRKGVFVEQMRNLLARPVAMLRTDGQWTTSKPDDAHLLQPDALNLAGPGGTRPVIRSDGRLFRPYVTHCTGGATIVVAYDVTSLSAELARAQAIAGIAGTGAFLLVAGAGLASLRSRLRPLRDLAQTMNRAQQIGEFDTPVEPAGCAESVLLADAFNGMADRITDQIRRIEDAERRAWAAAEARSQFLANMSHEIRTPMTAILGYADLLLDPNASDDERAECIHTIRRNGSHLLSIINDVLDLARIESGACSLESQPTSPIQAVEETLSIVGVRAHGKGLTLQTRIDWPIPRTIPADPLRLRQILINLVSNAVKFTESGSVTVRLQLTRDDADLATLHVHVIDTGIGIPPEHHHRLFQPFVQADESMSRRFGGTGLGLTISQRLARLMGGDITFQSEPGRGSTFSLHIPCGPYASLDLLHEPPHADPDHDDPDSLRLSGRILLAEDGDDNRRLFQRVLNEAGALVTCAADGREALDAVRNAREPFNLILMDIQMPGIDGLAATADIRKLDPSVPIVALTAHALPGDRDRCLRAGCNDYLTKPLARSELLAACARWLDPARRRAAA